MLGVIIKRIESLSSRRTATLLVCVARAALGSPRSYRSGGGGATSYTCSLADLIDRGVAVSILDFEIPTSEAVRRFEDYQRKSCMYLHARNLLGRPPGTRDRAPGSTIPGSSAGAPGVDACGANPSSSNTSTLTAAYLPYWCFEATFNSETYGKLGFKDSRTGEMVWKDKADPLPLSTGAVAPFGDPAMQVYASYKYVRDVGSGAAGPGLPLRCRVMTQAEAKAGHVGGVALHPADMRQGVAWQLAVRALTHKQLQAAEEALRQTTGATDLRDVRVALQVLTRRCSLVFLPAYIAVYQYGSRYKQGTSGVIVPQVFTAVVGGTKDGQVVATEHLCPTKASLSAGGLVGGLGLLAGEATWATPLLGLETLLPQLGSVEALTLAVLAASGAGMYVVCM
ncbi:hypothetical protein Vretifemale_933 [Volvox reticuliferus]|uniref:Uncharacterized protein n=1 Tax=Volvox reticuliferus TaxID=1737510 RepID=A0A8J4BW25_9CHLO|nr:hypothetical protein Vretifemale_933 [Volvox reticuliferus]